MDYIALFIAAFIFGITPGPGTLATLTVSTRQGFWSGILVSLGEVMADVIYLTIAIVSLKAISDHLSNVLYFIRIFGALYLLYLSYTLIKNNHIELVSIDAKNRWYQKVLFGFFVGSTNPKVILFYLSFLPAFIDLSTLNIQESILTITTVYLGVLGSLVVVCFFGHQIKNFLKKGKNQKITNYLTSILLACVAILLVF